MDSKFILRFPIEITEGKEISITDDNKSIDFGSLKYLVKRTNNRYIFIIEGFNSEKEAEEYIKTLWGGLMWVLLNRQIPFIIESLQIADVTYYKDPVKAANNIGLIGKSVDGMINGKFPSIYNAKKKNILSLNGFPPSISISTPIDIYYRCLFEGVSLHNISDVILSEKFKTALELYAASFHETSRTARFLTLVMVLEALSVNKPRSIFIQKLINKWGEEIEKIKHSLKRSDDEIEELEMLKNEINFRKKASIRSSIRKTIIEILDANGDSDSKDVAKEFMYIYDKRSSLLHDGIIPDNDIEIVLNKALNIVPRILKSKFLQIASPMNV